MQQVSANAAKLANNIVNYDTQQKGFAGRLFGYEARDGFWSKAGKTLSTIGGAASWGVNAFLLTALTGGGIVLPIAAATAAGLAGGLINRMATKSIISDVHDSRESNLGKFGQYLLSGVPSVAMSVVATLNPITALAAAAATPFVSMGTSKVLATTIGNQEQRETSIQARELAAHAIQQGQSVEQIVGLERTTNNLPNQQSTYHNSVTPDEYAQMQSRLAQNGQTASFAETTQQRAAAETTEHSV